MIEYVKKWNGSRYVSVPKPQGSARVVTLDAGQVRGSRRTVYAAAFRGRPGQLQDHHIPAEGTGRTTSKSQFFRA